MNVGLFTDTYFPQLSGVATSINILKQQLEENGHKVYVFTTTDPQAVEEKNVFRYESIPFVFFKDRRIAVTTVVPIIRKVKQLKIDIIHTHTEFSMGLAGVNTGKMLGLPVIHTYHTWYDKYLHYLWNGKIITRDTVKILSKFFCNQTDAVIVPSETIKTVLLDYNIYKPINILPTGVPLPQKIDNIIINDLRARLNLAPNDYVLLSVNRLAEEKNLLSVLNKMEDLRQKLPQVKLVLVGDGPQREELEIFVHKNKLSDTVMFVGFVAHEYTDAYYQMADLYVNLSLSETQGLTFIEAITNQLPVVAMDSDYLLSLEEISPFGKLLSDTNEFVPAIIDMYEMKQNAILNLQPLIDEVSAETFYNRVIKIYEREISYKGFYSRPFLSLTNKFYLENTLDSFKRPFSYRFKDFTKLKNRFKS